MTQLPEDYCMLEPWFPAIRHLRNAARQSTGVGVLTMRILIDEYGRPKLWMMPELIKLVPRATADEALTEIIKGLIIE